jgi:formylglycine-generating enzyme required for sulfatase activity
VRRAFGFTVVAIAIIACNALTGVGDLSVGTASDAGGGDGSIITGSSSGSSGAASSSSGSSGVGPDGAVQRPEPPSCGAGLSCGVSSGNIDCCESTAIPGGTFERGNSTDPKDMATVSPFYLDRFEVTVARFRAFKSSGGGTQQSPPAPNSGAHPKVAGSGWNPLWNTQLAPDGGQLNDRLQGGTWTNTPDKGEQRPMSNVSWFEAYAFCIWDGGRLPTYAEWSFAASGGSEQREYPWSQPPTDKTIDSNHAVWNCAHVAPPNTCPPPKCSDPGISGTCNATSCGVDGGTCVNQSCFGCDFDVDLPAVGSAPAGIGKFGQFDLAGSVSEITLDAKSRKDNVEWPTPCNDCTQLMAPYPHKAPTAPPPPDDYQYIVAGGDWGDDSGSVEADVWFREQYDDRSGDRGFRCARDQ